MKILKAAILFCLPIYTFIAQVDACTGITVKTKDGGIISARTLEFAMQMDSKIIFLPRGFKTDVVFSDGKKGASWKQKYAVLGINGLNQNVIMEGFNEKGLSIGAFYLPGYAVYDKLTDTNAKNAISSSHFMTWVAGNFATVDEVKKNLDKIVVVDNTPEGINAHFPLHYRITDSSGAQIVVEYVKNGMKVYDNPLGIITNSPEFDWHITNLSNYVNLTPTNVIEAKIEGVKIDQLGQGSGMHGLPGDYTPPSRFIRSMAIQGSALAVETAEEGVNLAWHIINNTDIPIGATRETEPNGKPYFNYTQWVNVSDLKNLKLYFRTYNNPLIKMVDMKKFNLDSSTVKLITMDTKPLYQDVSESTD